MRPADPFCPSLACLFRFTAHKDLSIYRKTGGLVYSQNTLQQTAFQNDICLIKLPVYTPDT